jgi:citrate synthase
MPVLKDILAERIPSYRERITKLVNEYGEQVISEVTLKQTLSGLRGVRALMCDTSCVHAETGLSIRGRPIADLADHAPEELFFLMLTSDLPDKNDLEMLRQEINEKAEVPEYVWRILRSMPGTAHPMDMLITAIASLEDASIFRLRYEEGMERDGYWEAALDDSLTLLAKLPALAAAVYRIRYDKGDLIPHDPTLSWAANFAHMLGNDDEDFADMIRLYLVIHCDHEGGDASTFASRIVGSGLADAYYAVTAGLCGMAGPLHGLATQEALRFNLGALERFGGPPTPEQMAGLAWEVLNAGQVIPGFGHPVLNATDPRFTAFCDFAKIHLAENLLFKTVEVGAEVIPGVLKEQGKARAPWPNVDGVSGTVLHHYGLTESEYDAVLFSVSRAMGMLAQLVLCRATLEPMTTPKSVTLEWLTTCMEATEVAMTPGD